MRAGPWLIAILLMLAAGCALAEPPVIEVARHVIVGREPLQLSISGADDGQRWTVRDWQGSTVAAGEGTAPVQPPLDRYGYFELEVSTAAGIAKTSFVRLRPPRVIPGSAFGVMTHFAHGWEDDLIPVLAQLGLRHFRDELYWSRLEQKPGVFEFPQAYVSYMEKLAASGITPLIELTFGNPLYDGGTTPSSPRALAAYAAYAEAVLDRYGTQLEAVEVWNEINGTWCDGACPADRVGTYARLLAAASKVAKTRRPDLPVVGGVTAGVPLPWLKRLMATGALADMDVLSVHSYREEPEGAEREITELRALLRAHGRELPIWVTETGSGGPSDEDRRAAAIWLVKQLTVLRTADVERIYWYLGRDYDSFEGLGLVRGPDSPYGRYAPNPAYAAYATVIGELDGAEPRGRDGLDRRTHLHRFTKDGRPIAVVWSSDGDSELTFSQSLPLEMVDLAGNVAVARPQGGRITLEVTGLPIFLRGAGMSVAERRSDTLLASSELDFTINQDGQWSYGWTLVGPGSTFTAPPQLTPMVVREDDWSVRWGRPDQAFVEIGPSGAHPGVDGGHQIAPVRRWRSDTDGEVSIAGTMARPGTSGDGTKALILVDGALSASVDLQPGARRNYDLEVRVRPGTLIDFVVTPGPGLDEVSDATGFTARITCHCPELRVSEP